MKNLKIKNHSYNEKSHTKQHSSHDHFHKSFKIHPNLILKHLKEEIVGQDKAQKMISALVYNHFKRSYLNLMNKSNEKYPTIKKTNALFIGPTGSGINYFMLNILPLWEFFLEFFSVSGKFLEKG